MKFTQTIQREVDVQTIDVILPVRYNDEDIPYDAPGRYGDKWQAEIDIATGGIYDWPRGKTLDMYMKVVDGGIYILRDSEGINIAERNDYVPHGIVPGEFGDYVDLKINENGIITNWPTKISLCDFEGFGRDFENLGDE
jgi:hypothetical protein